MQANLNPVARASTAASVASVADDAVILFRNPNSRLGSSSRQAAMGLVNLFRPVEDFEHPLDRFSRIGSLRGRGEIQFEAVLAGEPHERPVVDESPAIQIAQVIEDDFRRLAEACRHLEEIDWRMSVSALSPVNGVWPVRRS